MICKVCGRMITNEEANFCEYCGASFRPGTDNKISEESASFINRSQLNETRDGYAPFEGNQQMGQDQSDNKSFFGNGMPGQNGMPRQNGMPNQNGTQSYQGKNPAAPAGLFAAFSGSNDKPMTVGNWIAVYLIPFIPMVGLVFSLVLLFTWGFGANTVPAKKNWARATMIMIVVMIVIFAAMLSSGYLGDYSTMINELYGSM